MSFVGQVHGSPESIPWQTKTIDGVQNQGSPLLTFCWWHVAVTEFSRIRQRKQRTELNRLCSCCKQNQIHHFFEKCRCLTLWFIVLRFTNIKSCFRDFPKVNHDYCYNWDAILLYLADKNFIENTFLTWQFCKGLLVNNISRYCFPISRSMTLKGEYWWNSFLSLIS